MLTDNNDPNRFTVTFQYGAIQSKDGWIGMITLDEGQSWRFFDTKVFDTEEEAEEHAKEEGEAMVTSMMEETVKLIAQDLLHGDDS